MAYPRDYLDNEKFNIGACEYFLEVFRFLQTAEKSMLLKLKVLKRQANYTGLVTTLFERNDFQLIEMIVKHFLLRLPLVKLRPLNSATVCGEIVSIVVGLCSREDSFFREYRKKLYSILAENLPFVCRLIISSFTLNSDPGTQPRPRPLPLYCTLLVELVAFVVRWDSLYKGRCIAVVCETVWDIALEWFFLHA